MHKKPKILLIGLSILSLVAILPLYLISNYSVDIFSDDQIDGEVPYEIVTHGKSFIHPDLFSQQLEHRPVINRTIGKFARSLPNWSFQTYVYLKFFSMFVAGILIYLIFTNSIKNPIICGVFALVFSSLFFGIQQIETWTNPVHEHGFIFIVVLSILYISTFKIHFSLQFCIFAIAAFLCTFTFFSGITFWFILFVYLFLGNPLQIFSKWKYAFLWCFFFLLTGFLYFHDYSAPSESPGIGPALESPIRVLIFYFCVLGSSLSNGTDIPAIPLAFSLGVVFTALYLIYLFFYINNRRSDKNKEVNSSLFPWIVLGLSPIINIGLTAIGRCGFGLEMALASRYGTPANFLIISILAMTLIIFYGGFEKLNLPIHNRNDKTERKLPQETSSLIIRNYPWIPASLITVILIFQLSATFYIFPHYEMMRHLKTNAKAATLFSEFIIDRDLLGPLWRHPTMEPFLKRIDFMDKNGLLRPNRPKTNLINKIIDKRYFSDQELRDLGAMEGASRIDEQRVVINGWALDSNGKRPADAILLTIRNPNGDDELVGFARIGFERNDLASAKGSKKYFRSGWQKVVEIETLKRSSNGNRMKAWAYDTTTGFSRPLAGEMSIQ